MLVADFGRAALTALIPVVHAVGGPTLIVLLLVIGPIRARDRRLWGRVARGVATGRSPRRPIRWAHPHRWHRADGGGRRPVGYSGLISGAECAALHRRARGGIGLGRGHAASGRPYAGPHARQGHEPVANDRRRRSVTRLPARGRAPGAPRRDGNPRDLGSAASRDRRRVLVAALAARRADDPVLTSRGSLVRRTWPTVILTGCRLGQLVERGPVSRPGKPLTNADHHPYERQVAAVERIVGEFRSMAAAADHDARVDALLHLGYQLNPPKNGPPSRESADPPERGRV